jgi:hypothetical protein
LGICIARLEAGLRLRLGCSLQLRNFLRVEHSRFARREIQFKRTIPHTTNLLHVMSDFLEHLADLAVAPFMQCNFEPGIFGLFDDPDLCRRGSNPATRISLLGDRDSGAKTAKLLFLRLTGHLDEICFRNMRGSLHELVRKIAVVGKQKQSLAVEIQASDRINPRFAAY